jgi:hypothetical protein
MQFVHQALTWGFLLALVPLLIHLINMMRHRRVRWAAMEFLLASYKKHRKWIWLKQLLLLLARIAAVALVVAMLAQLKTRDQWVAIFGGRVTHHYVILDDSYSMSDRVAGASAMDAAKQVIEAIVARATQEDSPQKLTLVRYSAASRQGSGVRDQESGDTTAAGVDFNAEPIDANFDVDLERKIRALEATQLAVGPQEALTLVRQLLDQASDETKIVYLLSDFRQKDWRSPAELRDALGLVRRSQAEVHLVNCSRSTEPNLGVVAIEPADETRAAGVPLFVNVRVKNFGAKSVSKVQLKLQATFYSPGEISRTPPTAADTLKGQVEELATLLIDQIGPGETVARRVQVYFPEPGKHVVEATLPEDPVEADNHRLCVIDFPVGERVLVIDGSGDEQNAYYLGIAFRPLERSNTGIRPDVKPVSFLRDATAGALAEYSAIYLLDVARLDGGAVASLESYVQGGGGLGIFVGPNVATTFYNQSLYKEGRGVLPAPLGVEAPLPAALDPAEPDIVLGNHPIFAFFQSETNPLIRGVKVDRYRKVADSWKPSPEQAVEVIARTRDKSPLLIAKKFGHGEVMLFLTTLAPVWNDWAKNPSFVVVALKLQSYLAAARRPDDPRLVGTPLDVVLEGSGYMPEVTLVLPGGKAGTRQRIELQATPTGAGTITQKTEESTGGTPVAPTAPSVPTGATGAGGLRTSLATTERAGIYEAWARTTKGDIEVRRWAFNVDPEEGDLTQVPSADLLARLDPVKVNYHAADSYQQDEVASSGYNLSMLLLGGLVLLLVGEQLLAYSASYHVSPGVSRP